MHHEDGLLRGEKVGGRRNPNMNNVVASPFSAGNIALYWFSFSFGILNLGERKTGNSRR